MELHMVAPRFHPVTGGIETAVLETGKRATARGWDVTVHCLRHDKALPSEDAVAGLAVRRHDARLRLGYYTTMFRPDIPEGAVAHLHAFAHRPGDHVLATHPPERTLLTTHHGVTFPTGNPLFALYHALYRRRALPRLARLHRVIAINRFDRERLVEGGVPPERVEVIPNGIPDHAFDDPPEAAGAHGAGAATPEPGYVLYLGRLHREKAVADLVRAAPELGAPVVIAGPDGGERAHLERLAAKLGVADRVTFIGRVGEGAKRRLLHDAACLALPSRHEGQGIVVLEAWAQGTPVVASATEGVRDTVDRGRNGLLHAPGDVDALAAQLRELLEDPKRAREMGARGREKAWEAYRWDVLAGRVADLYAEALER